MDYVPDYDPLEPDGCRGVAFGLGCFAAFMLILFLFALFGRELYLLLVHYKQ